VASRLRPVAQNPTANVTDGSTLSHWRSGGSLWACAAALFYKPHRIG
jgi:hypothetical protein